MGGATHFERCADCGGSGMYWTGEDMRLCPECKGDTVVRASPSPVEVLTPRVVDNDRDEITVTLDGKEIRGWSYETEIERRVKMRMAREFCEGWYSALSLQREGE